MKYQMGPIIPWTKIALLWSSIHEGKIPNKKNKEKGKSKGKKKIKINCH
jgi:hypothetical protein